MVKLEQFSVSGEVIDIQAEFQKLTFDVISNIALGYDLNSQEDPECRIGKAWDETLKFCMWKFVNVVPYWKLYKTKYVKEAEAHYEYLTQTIRDIIIKKQKEFLSSKREPESLLELMIHSNQIGESNYTMDDMIRHMTYFFFLSLSMNLTLFFFRTFLFAGHDTTQNILVWLQYYLCMNPEVENSVIKEIEETYGENASPEAVTSQSIHGLTYLNNVIKETLRLKCSAPSLTRYLIRV